MKNGTCEEIGGWIRALVYAVLRREEMLWSSCPKMAPDAHREAMKEVYVIDKGVRLAIRKLRSTTGGRLAPYSDSEVILTCFAISSIWHSARDLAFDSARLGDLVGRHKPELLAELSVQLISGKSEVCRFLSLRWDEDSEPAGHYRFKITQPKMLQKIIFGNAVLMM